MLHAPQSHPSDVVGEKCAICGYAEGAGSDWLQCNSCNAFQHLACDKREGLGTAADFSMDGAKVGAGRSGGGGVGCGGCVCVCMCVRTPEGLLAGCVAVHDVPWWRLRGRSRRQC